MRAHLVTRVIDHKIHDNLHIPFVAGVLDSVPVL